MRKSRRVPSAFEPRRPVAVILALLGLVAVLATSQVRADSSTLATITVVWAVALAAFSAPPAIGWLTKFAGTRLLRRPNRDAASLIAGARLSRVRSKGARTALLLVPAFVIAIAVAPVVAQVAPRDALTAQMNQRTGRVVALITPVPSLEVQQKIRELPGVLATSAPQADAKGVATYTFDCASFKRLLDQTGCVEGKRVNALEMSPELSAGWPYTGSWTFLAGTTNGQAEPQSNTGSAADPLVVLTKDSESYWTMAASARGIDPLLDTEANTGGLIGGAQQTYFAMQQWLKTGLALLLLTSGLLMGLGAVTDVRERARLQRAMNALGSSPGMLVRAVGTELLVRSCTLVAAAALVGFAVATAAQGWGNTESVGVSWAVGCFTALLIAVAIGAVAPLVALAGPPPVGHEAEDAYSRA